MMISPDPWITLISTYHKDTVQRAWSTFDAVTGHGASTATGSLYEFKSTSITCVLMEVGTGSIHVPEPYLMFFLLQCIFPWDPSYYLIRPGILSASVAVHDA